MPLITCPDCQTEISDAAPSCIKCGRPMEEWERNAIKAQKEKLANEKLAKEKLAKKNNTQYIILVIAGMLLAIFAFTSSSDDSSTSTADLQCLPVASSVIRSINSRAVWKYELDVDSGWAVEVKKYNGYFIAAKIRRPPEINGRIDIFYTDEISYTYTPSYLLAVTPTTELAFPSPGVKLGDVSIVRDMLGIPERFQEFRDAIECAMR